MAVGKGKATYYGFDGKLALEDVLYLNRLMIFVLNCLKIESKYQFLMLEKAIEGAQNSLFAVLLSLHRIRK